MGAKAMKAMKAMAVMKAMKAMKKKAVSKIAKGKLAKVLVFRGSKAKTTGGLTASGLTKNKHGKVVSKKALANGKGLRQHQGLDCRCPEGQEGTWREGLCRNQEGHSTLQEGQGVLQLNALQRGCSSGCGDIHILRAP